MENILNFRSDKISLPRVFELLRLYRSRSKLTQAELARQLNLQSDRMVNKWENGRSLPDPARLSKLIGFYLREGIFSPGEEFKEAQGLWKAVKAAFELQSTNFEFYTIFDTTWFEGLLAELVVSKTPQPPRVLNRRKDAGFNLPLSLTGLVGREQQKVQARGLLQGTRLLTLSGSAGVGKTRLGLKIAHEVAGEFRDGVRFVSLETLAEPENLAGFIARTFQVEGLPNLDETGSDSDKYLSNFLRSKELLLTLDGCDRFVGEVGALLDRLLKACPGLKTLTTSRESLGVGGETVFRVKPLDLSENNSPAAELFIERAEAILPGFKAELTTGDLESIGRICRSLDGLPLAIELAAGLAEGIGLAELETHLGGADPFSLLKKRDSREQPLSLSRRYHSLQASLDYSYTRLNQAERTMLWTIASLPANPSFDLLTAEEAFEAARGEHDRGQAFELLNNLVKKSLVETFMDEADEIVHFSLLEVVRKYALKYNED